MAVDGYKMCITDVTCVFDLNARSHNAPNSHIRKAQVTDALRTLLNKADPQSQGGGRAKVTSKLYKRRQPRSTSMYSLCLSPLVSLKHLQSAQSACLAAGPTHSPVAEFTALYQLWARGGGGGEVYPIQASDSRALRPEHAYMDHHLTTGVLPNTARWTTTYIMD